MALSSTSRRRRARAIAAAAVVASVMLGALATMIVRAQHETRQHIGQNLRLRAGASAELVSTYLQQQAERQKRTAEKLLSTPSVSPARFDSVVTVFGSRAAVLLDSTGRLIDMTPRRQSLLGRQVASGYAHLRTAEAGEVAFSGVVPSEVDGEPVSAIAVPFQTPLVGRRVFSVAYRSGGPALQAFVDHAIAYPQHEVALIDASERLLADSPRSNAVTLAQVDPALAKALQHGSFGTVPGAPSASTFSVAAVPGTPWRIVLMVPDDRLYSSIGGLAEKIPWLVFVLVSVLALLLLMLFARLLADRSRLAALTAELQSIARTDPLTGLSNRRGIEEDVTRTFARARRRSEPVAVLMIDLDRFKQVNDTHGHEAGDRVLVALADCMRDTLRSEDIFGRVGGDEFVAVLSDSDEETGRAAAGRLLLSAASVPMPELGLPDGIPMSIGVAAGAHTTFEDLMREADADLYRVKGEGRAAGETALLR